MVETRGEFEADIDMFTLVRLEWRISFRGKSKRDSLSLADEFLTSNLHG